MKKKEKTKEDFIEWIKNIVDYYSPILGIQLNNIGVDFKNTIEYLEIQCTYPYLDPDIHFSERAFENWKIGELKEDCILHELCHIITDPFYAKANYRFSSEREILDERERLTDTIAAIIRKLL